MNNTIVDNVKLMYYKNLQKQGKFDEYLKKNPRTDKLTIFLVKQDYSSFQQLPTNIKYQILKQNKFDISNLHVEQKANIAAALINAGYTNILNEVDFHIGDNKKEFYDELMRRCTKNESYYKLFIDLLSEEELLDAIIKDNNFFLYLPDEKKSKIKGKLLDKNPSILKKFPKEEQIKIVLDKPYLISQVDQDIVIEVLKENPSLISRLDTKKDMEQYIIIPEIRKSLPREKIVELISGENIINNLVEISKTMSDDEIIDFILHSNIEQLSATGVSGSRVNIKAAVVHELKNSLKNKDIFMYFSSLSIDQVSKLIEVDPNYILECIDYSNIEVAKKKTIEIFKNMYGEVAYNKLSSSFESVFNNWKRNPNGNSLDEMPPEELKLLFNDKILKTCPGEILIGYFDKLDKGIDVSEDFKKIIELTYGERARKILDSRPNLNVHSISSLEVFDERILNTFGEAFVHNCITYALYDFSGFLDVIKNPEKLELFKYYYDIVCKVYGENVETMQRCISEFSFNEELLRNIKDIDLTEEQSKNLINVLASEKNLFDIKTLEDLDRFNIIANEKLKETMLLHENSGISDFKDSVSRNLFGLRADVDDRAASYHYGDSVNRLLSLYDFSNHEGCTDEEIKLIELLSFINKEKDKDKIIDFISEGISNGSFDTRFYLELNQMITKVVEREFNIIGSKITTIADLDRLFEIEKEKPEEERTVNIEMINGIKHINLEGCDFSFLTHIIGRNMSISDVINYEGQAGNMAICTRLLSTTMTKDFDRKEGRLEYQTSQQTLIYAPNDQRSYVAFQTSDAGTDGGAKDVRLAGGVDSPISKIEQLSIADNEVSFYRYNRDNKNISNDNAGGRVYPIAIVGTPTDEKTLELCRKHNIAIIHFNAEKYKKKTEQPDLTTGLEQPVLESTGRSL